MYGIVALVVIVVVGGKMLDLRANKGLKSQWTDLATQIQGTPSANGASGTYRGFPVEAKIDQVSAMVITNVFGPGMIAGDLGGWLYRITARSPKIVDSWIATYDGTSLLVSPPESDPALTNRLTPLFSAAGAGKLTSEPKTGVVVFEQYTKITGKEDIRQLGKQPLPTATQFAAQLDLVASAAGI